MNIIKRLFLLLSISIFITLHIIDSDKHFTEIASLVVLNKNGDFLEITDGKIIQHINTSDYDKAKLLYSIKGVFLVISIFAVLIQLKKIGCVIKRVVAEYMYKSSLHYNYRKYRIREVIILLIIIVILILNQEFMEKKLDGLPLPDRMGHYIENERYYMIISDGTHKQITFFEYYFLFYVCVYVNYIGLGILIPGLYFVMYIRLLPWFIEIKNM